MVPSVTCWYDVLVWGKWEYFGWWSTVVQYVRVCLTDGIAYCTITFMSWLHVIPHGYAHPLFNNVNNPAILFSITVPYAKKSYDVFPKVPYVWAICLNMLKQTSIIFKWLLVESIFNNFHFKLLELHLNVHLCFNYIVLI